MAQQLIHRAGACDVYCYDTPTDADEVNETLKEIIRAKKMTVNVWVISGTHGTNAGTVDPLCAEPDFKDEDVASANKCCKNIHILDYHMLSANRWREISGKSAGTNVIVLAFCYSSLWFANVAPLGNNGKL